MSDKSKYISLAAAELKELDIDLSEIWDQSIEKKKDDSFTIMLVNLSTLCIELFRINNASKWTKIPPICKTCNGPSYDACYNAGSYKGVCNVGCSEPTLTITIATMPDAQGHARGASYSITPNCGISGAVIGIQ